jgi:tetrapyrrole methylase family protein/MazG family protein
MCEELGDLLLQVMLHAQMEAEAGTFDVYDVIEGLSAKLIRRHPHVFGDRNANDAEEALENWNAIKAEEKKRKGVDVDNESVLAGVPRDLPGLLKAWKLQQKAAKVGFDWDRTEDVFAKIDEEIRELKEASVESRAEELGDLLFSVVNLARFLNVDPEAAIAQANRKFVRRFAHIERQLRLRGEHFDRISLEKLEQLWQEAKKL